MRRALKNRFLFYLNSNRTQRPSTLRSVAVKSSSTRRALPHLSAPSAAWHRLAQRRGVGEYRLKESAGNRFGQQSQPPPAFVESRENQLRLSIRFFPERCPAERCYPSGAERCLKLRTHSVSKSQLLRRRES